MERVLMRAVIVDEGDQITVRLGITDKHVARCPNCLALFALRLSAAILNAIEEIGDDDVADDLHGLH